MKGNKILAGILSAAMVLATMAVPAFAEETGATLPIAKNGTITLTENVTDNVIVQKGTNLTIDLNGYTITNKTDTDTITNNGILIIKDSSANKSGRVDNTMHGKTALFNDENARVSLYGGTFERSAEAGTDKDSNGGNSYYTIKNWGKMYIYDGVKVENKGKFSSALTNGYYNITTDQKDKTAHAELIINGGTFEGGLWTVKNDDAAELTISGGTFKNNAAGVVLNNNVAYINGGTFTAAQDGVAATCRHINETVNKGELTITGGAFESPVTNKYFEEDKDGKITVYGGKFNSLDKEAVIADGVQKEIDGEYTSYSCAKIGDTLYENLNAAIKAANSNTVTLLTDVTGAGIVVPEKSNLTIDLNNHTYTVGASTVGSTGTETQALQLLKDSNITIQNGTITSEKALYLVQNYSNLTLNNVMLDGTKLATSVPYTLSNNNGNIKINNSTIIAAANGFAFDVCDSKYYPSTIVTVDKDSKIIGLVEISSSKDTMASALKYGDKTYNTVGKYYITADGVKAVSNNAEITGTTATADTEDNSKATGFLSTITPATTGETINASGIFWTVTGNGETRRTDIFDLSNIESSGSMTIGLIINGLHDASATAVANVLAK